MKKKLALLCSLVIFNTLISVNECYAYEDTNVVSVELYHSHIGSSSGGGCYTSPVYHSHTGSTSSGGGCYTSPVYHSHTGNTSSGGGCYTVPKTGLEDATCTITEGKQSVSICTDSSHDHTNEYSYTRREFIKHSDCGIPTEHGDWVSCGSGGEKIDKTTTHTYQKEYTYYDLGCGKTTSSVEKYNLGCGKNNNNIEYYNLGCEMSTSSCIGKFELHAPTNYSKEITIDAFVSSGTATSSASVESLLWSDGSTGNSLTVTENGTYACTLSYKENGIIRTESLSIVIESIDNQAPDASLAANITEWTSGDVKLQVTAEDLKSGLANAPYSWDGGNTWGAETSYTVSGNDAYSVLVKDRVGNITTKNINVSNIDKKLPTASLATDITEWTSGNVNLEVTAEDLESGLADAPYSWDGGNTWGAETSYTVSGNDAYNVLVKDRVGNITSVEYEINNIDKTAPTVEIKKEFDIWEWNSSTMNLEIIAEDLESGLAELPYSWDDGNSWNDNLVYQVSNSGEYNLLVRDNAGNITSITIACNKAEKKEEPVVQKSEPLLIENVVTKTTKNRNVSSQDVDEEVPEEIKIPKKNPEVKEEIIEEKIEEIEAIIITEEEVPQFFNPQLIAAVAAGTGATTSGITIFIFFWVFRKCNVFDEYTNKKLGRVYVWKRKGRFLISIPNRIIRKCGTKMYISFSTNFVKAHSGKLIQIKVQEKVIEKNIDKKINFSV